MTLNYTEMGSKFEVITHPHTPIVLLSRIGDRDGNNLVKEDRMRHYLNSAGLLHLEHPSLTALICLVWRERERDVSGTLLTAERHRHRNRACWDI